MYQQPGSFMSILDKENVIAASGPNKAANLGPSAKKAPSTRVALSNRTNMNKKATTSQEPTIRKQEQPKLKIKVR